MNLNLHNPEGVWNFFNTILAIPRASGNEKRIIDFIKKFASDRKLFTKSDNTGNLLVIKEASAGCQDYRPVMLQAHVDMVCEKDKDFEFDFSKDTIPAYVDGDFVKTRGTTLGADDGIGVAVMLAVLDSKELKFGKIGCLFTVSEEVGLIGAKRLDKSLLDGFDTLINLDSEESNIFYIGCAGGEGTNADFNYEKIQVNDNYIYKKITVSGLLGGHSGGDIHKKRCNAILILNRLLWLFQKKTDFCLVSFNGGGLRNAIPRDAEAVIAFAPELEESFYKIYNYYLIDTKGIFAESDPGLTISVTDTDKTGTCIDHATRRNLICTLRGVPNGVIEMSESIPGIVETSTNVASVKFAQSSNKIQVVTTQRSLLELEKALICEKIETIFTMGQANVVHTNNYPGWSPNVDSNILKIAKFSYKRLFGEEPIVTSIHAGLECGILKNKNTALDMISLGPTITGVHSPSETLDIKSVEKIWTLLVAILREMK